MDSEAWGAYHLNWPYYGNPIVTFSKKTHQVIHYVQTILWKSKWFLRLYLKLKVHRGPWSIIHSSHPCLGLAILASHCSPDSDVTIVDQHVESLDVNDDPELVVIQVYITNAYLWYAIADNHR